MYAQNEFQNEYGSKSVEAQVNQIYKNLFDREADLAGLSYWTQQINLGILELAEIAVHLIWAAQNNDGGAADKLALANRTAAAEAYTEEIGSTVAGRLAYTALTVQHSSLLVYFLHGYQNISSYEYVLVCQLKPLKLHSGNKHLDLFAIELKLF